MDTVTVAHEEIASEEFRAALEGCAVINENWRVRLRVTGSDAARWLNGMLTNTATLEDGAGNYSFLLNAQGRLQGDAYLFREGAEFLLETSAAQQEKISQWLDHYIIMDDVALAPETHRTATLAVAGPSAIGLLTRLNVTNATIDDLPPLSLRRLRIANVEAVAVKDDVGCVPCIHLWHDPEHSRELQDALVSAGAVPAGADAWEHLRIAGGLPLYGVDMGDRDLAQETSQTRALHFSKGCYLGQEIVERIRSRGQVHRGWRGFTSEEELHAGAEIFAAGKAIGKLTSVAQLPLANGHKYAGLGIVRLQPLEEKAPLESQGAALHPTPLPFARITDNDNRSRKNG